MRVLLLDDHPVVLAGLKAFIREDAEVEVVGAASSLHEAIARAQLLHADVFLLTVSGRSGNAAERVTTLRDACPEIALLVLNLDADGPSERALVQAGATAVLAKEAGRDAIMAALYSLRGEDTGARRVSHPRDSTPPPSSGSSSLSRRELQVLTLIAEGYTNKQIADELGISVRTVETHRERLMRKLGVQGTAALTKAAIALGLVNAKG